MVERILMRMSRKCRTAHYDDTVHLSVTRRAALPPHPLARVVVDVISQLDVRARSARYTSRGGEAFAPEILLGLLLYGDATGVCSARKIARATYERLPCRFLAGHLPPDHDPIAHVRTAFLSEMQALCVPIRLLAQTAGGLQLGTRSLAGPTRHADASKRQAVSEKRRLALEAPLRQAVQELLPLGEPADRGDHPLPPGVRVPDAVALRAARLATLAQAKTVLEARAQERYQAANTAYEAKRRAREAPAQRRKRRPRGRHPTPPRRGTPARPQWGHRQPWRWTTGTAGKRPFRRVPRAASTPDIATGREPHHKPWRRFFAEQPAPPPADASLTVTRAAKRQTESGHAIDRLRTCTVEPVIGLIKDVWGFRQRSLRGVAAAAGEWGVGCLAFTRKRVHILLVV